MKHCIHCFGQGCSICNSTGPHVDLSNLPDLSNKRPFEDDPQPPRRADTENFVLGTLNEFMNHRITFADAVKQLTDRIHQPDNA